MTRVPEFWLVPVNIFGNLSTVDFTRIYSKQDITKTALESTIRCVEGFSALLPVTVSYDSTTLFENRDTGTHNTCVQV